jgi:drug/metabolite transporter (DMT)-like permease
LCALPETALAALAVPFAGLQTPQLRFDALAAVAVLGVLGTGAAYVLNYRLITDEGSMASVVTYLLPVVAVVLGVLVLEEPITLQVVAGMAIVLVSVALARRKVPTPGARAVT